MAGCCSIRSASPAFAVPPGARIWRRSLLYALAFCQAASSRPMPCRPTCRRAAFIITNIAFRPLPGSPTIQPGASSKRITQVGLPCRPIFSSMRSQTTALLEPSS